VLLGNSRFLVAALLGMTSMKELLGLKQMDHCIPAGSAAFARQREPEKELAA